MKVNDENSMIDIKKATTMLELLSHEDGFFIHCLFRTVLNRDPDDIGKNFYLSRLRNGESKMQIIAEIASSAEGRRKNTEAKWIRPSILIHRLKRILGIGRGLTKKTIMDAKQNQHLSLKTLSTSQHSINPVKITHFKPYDSMSGFKENNEIKQQSIWIDLTTSLEWKEGVVGIVRAELEIASQLHKLAQNIRFSMQIENGFVEIPKSELAWLLNAENVADAYMNFFNRYKNKETLSSAKTANVVELQVPDRNELYCPYKTNDVVIAVGWMDSQKEIYFSKVKKVLPDVYLSYLVYDIILLLEDTTYFYHSDDKNKFYRYIQWISHHCDFILYGGETAKNDTEALQQTEGWPTPLSASVKFGADIMKTADVSIEAEVLKELGIEGPFIMTVGSIEPRKNHDTLYRAYVMAQQLSGKPIPQLLICGRPTWRVDDLVDTIDRDPRLQGRVIRISPTDTQLAILYKNCLFTVLPSMYEGWSLTLPESLGQGKFCLCTDTPPLREIGKDLIDYAPKWDVRTWAEKIIEYSFDTKKLKRYEDRIKLNWQQISWRDCSVMLLKSVIAVRPELTQMITTNKYPAKEPTIWMDLTLTYIHWRGGVSGVIRAELNYARYLKKSAPDTRFFAYQDGDVFEVTEDYLAWLFNDSDLASAYASFQNYMDYHEGNKTGHRNPLKTPNSQVKPLDMIDEHSIVFFSGIDFSLDVLNKLIDISKNRTSILLVQLIYDFTPNLYSHTHKNETCILYTPFIEKVSNNFNFLIYGGRTAQRDGIAIQQQNGWRTPPSDFIEFGSNFEKIVSHDQNASQRDQEILSYLGVSDKFIMTVGTIEPRKNHEMLYKAYITLLQQKDHSEIPQMLFIGKKGWKVEDFMATFEADERIRGKILLLSPSDEELDTLYRHCMFTLLPSFYEGWSLTLPESLSYGKFCLTSDADPLKETGRDLVEYINPLDTYKWAERIHYYANNLDEIAKKEQYIHDNWVPRTWQESTQMLMDILYQAHKKQFESALIS